MTPSLLRPLILTTLLACVLLSAGAQERRVFIPWGVGTASLGVFRDEGYLRGPQFFDIDGNDVLIADAYKARVVRYSPQGKFLAETALPEVSPRMRAFQRTADGTYLVFNDQSFSRWTAAGELLGSRGLGLVVPREFWLTSTQAAAVLDDPAGTFALAFDRELTEESRFFLRTSEGSRAAVKDEGGGIWLVRWKDQASVLGWKASVDPEARLAAVGADASVWTSVSTGGSSAWKVDRRGALLAQGEYSSEPGNGLLIFRGRDLTPWTARWTDEGFLVESGAWKTASAAR